MSKKVEFTKKLQEVCSQLGQVADIADSLEELYFDRTYNSGGADAITDADISSTGLTAAQVGAIITLLQQFQNFVGNSAVTTADYLSTINIARDELPGG